MKIEIDGDLYEFPAVGSFDLDEDRIFFKGTGLHAEDVWLGIQDDGDLSFSELVKNEGFLPAMAHIAYRREHPDESQDTIFRVVGRQKRLNMVASLANSLAEDDAPGESEGATSAPPESSGSSSSEKPSTPPTKENSSGKSSETSSDQPDGPPGSTGTGGSGAPSTSRPLRQVV